MWKGAHLTAAKHISLSLRQPIHNAPPLCLPPTPPAARFHAVDTYTATNSGFKFTAADQIAYNAYLADTAHSLGLAVGLKNDVAQISDLGARFDFFVNEQCAYFKECGLYAPAKAGEHASRDWVEAFL